MESEGVADAKGHLMLGQVFGFHGGFKAVGAVCAGLSFAKRNIAIADINSPVSIYGVPDAKPQIVCNIRFFLGRKTYSSVRL
jgi:hypothetical protein